ncbi:putative amino acid transporter, transmembrane domain-containing protein [Rosa chinensis]|uniref:Putative amino acid transporter, transmembrane domain-containing protein n=1 Tax=Rosa chinensis TaxID=74649 RepID=A0A2P6QGW2_ROSCH|nr:putative amino acid transporter, transmembrane domain-containing protein [Rosa chinensis]
MFIAVIGYLMYGAEVQSQITFNLPTSEVGAKVAIYTLLLIPITLYALIITPIALAIEDVLPQTYQNRNLIQIGIRLVIMASNTLLANGPTRIHFCCLSIFFTALCMLHQAYSWL